MAVATWRRTLMDDIERLRGLIGLRGQIDIYEKNNPDSEFDLTDLRAAVEREISALVQIGA